MATSVTPPGETIETTKRPHVPGKLLFVVSLLVGVSLVFLLIVRVLAAHTAAQEAGTLNLVGQPVPDLTISIWNVSPEQRMRLSTLIHGRVAVVNFWASWCDPCQQEASELASASQTYESQGVSFVGVAMQTPQADGIAFLKKFGVPYPAGGGDTTQVNTRYELASIPETVIVDQHGIVRQVFRGPVSAQELAIYLNKLLRQ